MTKKQLRDMYPAMPYRHFMRDIINAIIKNERKISIEQASKSKIITNKEFEVFIAIIGEPIGTNQDAKDHTPTKEYLINNVFVNLPSRLVRAEINEIMKESRKYTDNDPVYDRVLTPKEYSILLDRLL